MFTPLLAAAAASPQWWLVGWVVSIALLLGGFGIGAAYYDGGDNRHTKGNEGEAA